MSHLKNLYGGEKIDYQSHKSDVFWNRYGPFITSVFGGLATALPVLLVSSIIEGLDGQIPGKFTMEMTAKGFGPGAILGFCVGATMYWANFLPDYIIYGWHDSDGSDHERSKALLEDSKQRMNELEIALRELEAA